MRAFSSGKRKNTRFLTKLNFTLFLKSLYLIVPQKTFLAKRLSIQTNLTNQIFQISKIWYHEIHEMGRGQVVRQWFLTPLFGGSSPSVPTDFLLP